MSRGGCGAPPLSALHPPLWPPGGEVQLLRWVGLLPVLEVRREMSSLEAVSLSPRPHHCLSPSVWARPSWLTGLVQGTESTPPSSSRCPAQDSKKRQYWSSRMLTPALGSLWVPWGPLDAIWAEDSRRRGCTCSRPQPPGLCMGRPEHQAPLGLAHSYPHTPPPTQAGPRLHLSPRQTGNTLLACVCPM